MTLSSHNVFLTVITNNLLTNLNMFTINIITDKFQQICKKIKLTFL